MKSFKDMVSIKDYKGTFGAAIGDIYGSYYEFLTGKKTPKEEISIHDSSAFTDDTVLTVAVADYLRNRGTSNLPCSSYLQRWARRYYSAGYGTRFFDYINQVDPKPYGSFGNGSAMRVSPVAFFASNLEEAESLATEVTVPTHNSKEGVKGAVVIAKCIFMALHGASRKEIADYARSEYNLDLDYDYLLSYEGHGEEICQVTVPQALWCFLHSDSFDDCLRLCLHIRWDADTLAAIACPIAEAYYKEMPKEYLLEAKKRLPKDMLEVLEGIDKGKMDE